MNIEFKLAGASFRTAEDKEKLKELQIGSVVHLKPDFMNVYDSNAIRVYLENAHIGFVPKTENTPIAAWYRAHGHDEANEERFTYVPLSATVVAFAGSPYFPVIELTDPEFFDEHEIHMPEYDPSKNSD